jgi:hypothetical protein
MRRTQRHHRYTTRGGRSSNATAWPGQRVQSTSRCIAHRGEHRAALQSRQQRQLTGYFPEIVSALEELDVNVVLDGELVLWTEGRTDFAALQRRLYPGASRAQQLMR